MRGCMAGRLAWPIIAPLIVTVTGTVIAWLSVSEAGRVGCGRCVRSGCGRRVR